MLRFINCSNPRTVHCEYTTVEALLLLFVVVGRQGTVLAHDNRSDVCCLLFDVRVQYSTVQDEYYCRFDSI